MIKMKKGLLILLAVVFCGTMYSQNGVESCFDGTFSLESPQCDFVNAPVSPACGPVTYYLPPVWGFPGLDVPTSLFIYTAFDEANVRIYSSDGLGGGTPSFSDQFQVTQNNPVDYMLTTNSNVNYKIATTQYNQIDAAGGLVIESDVPVTAIYRLSSAANKSFFVLKGQGGLGQGFYAGSQTDVSTPASQFEAHFVSVMALEDDTQVRFQKDGYSIEGPSNNSSTTGDIDLTGGLTITLDAGETYLIRDNVSSAMSVSGILVTADKPIVVNSGSSHSRHGSGVNDRDAGMDQLIPINKSGEEYVAIRGTNNTDIDYLIFIGIEDGNNVEVNGTNIGTLNAGEMIEYPLAGTGGEVYHIAGDAQFLAFHVSGLFDEEVGMAQLPGIEDCSGNRIVEFALVGSDNHLVNVIIDNSGLGSLTLNGNSYTTLATAVPVPGTNMSVVTFDQADLSAMGNRIESNELFHVGVTTGSDVGGSYGFITKYGTELVLFDPAEGVPLNVSSFEVLIDLSTASTTGLIQNIGAITCSPPANITTINGSTSSFVTPNGGTVDFTGSDLTLDYTSANTFIGYEELEVLVEDAAGLQGAVCLNIGVFTTEICGNGIDDDLDGEIDEIDECPVDPCLTNCNSGGCEPVIVDVFPESAICPDENSARIGILSSTPDVEYSINGGGSYQNDPSFFDLAPGSYNIVVRNRTTGCTSFWNNNPLVIDDPDCGGCFADAGEPGPKHTFCLSGTSTFFTVMPNTGTIIPAGYETVYILTREPDLVILDYRVGSRNFSLPGTGRFRIHTLIAETNNQNDENYFDLNGLLTRNESSLFTIIQCITNHGVCAALDSKGTLVEVLDETAVECAGPDENTIRKCNDGVDNDSDGLVDCMDPDCQTFMICAEDNAQNCNDGIDNDGDGLVDCADDECVGFLTCVENGKLCNDGIDNDQDGLIDCADDGCRNELYCQEDNVITCCDGRDNDGDGDFDCDDVQCSQWLYCRERTAATCTDGIDNDLDGLVDCADPNCIKLELFQCSIENNAINCSDGVDNDDDGLTDCFDADCQGLSICDNDGDGLAGVLDVNDNDPCIPFNSELCNDIVSSDINDYFTTAIDVKVLLQGPYDVFSGEMSTRLNEQGYLPGQKPWTFFGESTPQGQPYAAAPWNYAGTEGDLYEATGFTDRKAGYAAEVVDWVLISLRTSKGEESEVFKTAALLLSDGSVQIQDGFEFKNTEIRGYYIVIEHRNHMAVMSDNIAIPIEGKLTYDFTQGDSYKGALGMGQIRLADRRYAMIAGNPEVINSSNSYTDVNTRDLSAVSADLGANSGYFNCDLDLDGDVNIQDKSLSLENNGMFITLKF